MRILCIFFEPARKPGGARNVRAIVCLLEVFLLACLCLLSGCKRAPRTDGKIRIGFSMDSLQLERWQHDRDLFVRRAGELGAEVYVQSANGNDAVQVRQAENLLTQGVDVLVVVPHNGQICASIVDSAKRENIPVVSYDRLIRDSDVDFYVSYDNVKVGQHQAQYLLKRAPKGNYVLIGGTPNYVITPQNNYLAQKVPYSDQLNNNLYNSVSLNLNIPIFNTFLTRNRVKLARIQLKNTEYITQTTKIQLKQSIEQAYINMTSSIDRYKTLTEQLAAYSESFRLAEIRFNDGVITSVDYVIAKNNLDRTNINIIMARYDYMLRTKVLDYYQNKPLW